MARSRDPNPSPTNPPHDSFAARLKRQYGESVDPGVSLHAAEERSETGIDFSSALIARLSGRSGSFGRYRVRGEIARGGMGAILKIWDEDLNRHLAMKVILGQMEAPPSSGGAPAGVQGERTPGQAHTPPIETSKLARFLEEAQVTGQLDHPGIVPVHELGLDPEGRVYFTMKLVKGRSLKEVFDLVEKREEGWSQTKALGVLLKVCEAMAYAHHKGVIHRDLKPANVMVGKFGEVHVMDWGLARILGRLDERDLRIREKHSRSATDLRSERDEHRGETPESPLYTMDGDVVGTPAYMPPEQAAGRVEEMGPHSDVYALGAMLYHLLAGHMPYVPKSARLNNYAVWGLVQQGPPTPISQLARQTPVELVAICEKAMAREWKLRYRDMSEMAADLSAYLEHRVVGAHETGAWAETKKWVERNKPLAAALGAGVLALVAGLIVSLSLKREADSNAKLAEERRIESDHNSQLAETRRIEAEENAAKAQLQEAIANGNLEDVLSLSAIQDLTDLETEADRLWPAEPSRLKAYEAWLGRAQLLVEGRPADPAQGVERKFGLSDHKAKLLEIRGRATPLSEEGREADRRASKKYAEWEKARAERTWIARMLGKEAWPPEAEVEAELERESLPSDAIGLDKLAWPSVDPDPTKAMYGSEVKALVLARRAVAAATAAERAELRNTLGWALYRTGKLDLALAEERRAVEEATEQQKEELAASLKSLEDNVAAWREDTGRAERSKQLAETEARLAELATDVNVRRTYEFEDGGDRWWHAQLARLVSNIEAFVDPTKGLYSSGISPEHSWGIVKRQDFAATITERSITGMEAKQRWEEAILAISKSEKYWGTEWPGGARLSPQFGLLPIGPDPESGLWEFSHLATGENFEPAKRGADGQLVLREGTGIVLVLIPGGTFTMGAQRLDSGELNYDPQAGDNESPPHQLTLSPYFLSKHEMTQGQWIRAVGRNPSQYAPDTYSSLWNRAGKDGNLLHPVENVSWQDGAQFLGQHGLMLPTEAQWEYGARAGTSTVYWSGDDAETLRDAGNVADAYAKSHGGGDWTVVFAAWDDGNVADAEVGSYRANANGLHDVHGNLWEWCRDGYGSYELPCSSGDGERQVSSARFRVIRGGSSRDAASDATSANRYFFPPDRRDARFGLRPARGITP